VQVVGLEPALVETNVVSALITIGLLRSHEALTQMRCIDALHNVLANSTCRQQVLSSDVIWALQKLVCDCLRRSVARVTVDFIKHPLLVHG
jgi:hypothetical protein